MCQPLWATLAAASAGEHQSCVRKDLHMISEYYTFPGPKGALRNAL